MKKCPRCDAINAPDDQFCYRCTARLSSGSTRSRSPLTSILFGGLAGGLIASASVFLGVLLAVQTAPANQTPIVSAPALEDVRVEALVSPRDPVDATVYVARTGQKYHAARCRYLPQGSIPMKLSDAKRRFTPCSVCNPPR